MADPRRLKIRVQTDRLPDVAGKAQIALRVSAAIEGADGVLAVGAIDEILPWKWKSAAAVAWDPHQPESWRIWSVDPAAGGAPIEVAGAKAVVAGDLAATVAKFDADGRFAARRDAEIASVVADLGLETAVALPAGASELTGRSVFGLVESLTGLPHPVGAAARVFTLFTLDPAPVSSALRFFAAPLFAPSGGGAYDLDAAAPIAVAGSADATYRIHFAARAGAAPMFADGDADMRLSLSGAEIAPPADPERLIDMSTMRVLKPPRGHGLVDDDFAAPLARRLAETVDPWARALGALDSVMTKAVADEPRFLHALETDLGGEGPSWLLAALDAFAWRALGSRAAACPIAAPAMATWLLGIAGRRPEFLPAAAALILGAANRGPGAPGGDRSLFASVTAARLRGLIGLAFRPVSGEALAIDTDEGLRQFAARRWLGGPDPAPARPRLADGARRAVAAAMLDLPPSLAAFGVGAATSAPAALIDLERAAAAAPATFAFALDFAPATDVDFILRLSFRQPPGRPPAPEVVVTGRAGGAAYDVAVVVGGAIQAHAAWPRGSVLPISIELGRVGGTATVLLTAAGGASADAGALLTAPFYLEFGVAGTALDLGLATTDQTKASLRAAFDRVASGQALRSEFAIATVGPYLPGLIAGRLTWSAPQPDDERGRLARKRLDERLAPSVAALVGAPAEDGSRPVASLYGILSGVAVADADGACPGAPERAALAELFERVIEAARTDAVRLARALSATLADPDDAGDDLCRRLTVDSRPLAFRFDQLQGVAGDLWTRLSGLGVLLARTRTLAEPVAAWRGLNVATLHAPPTGPRPPLGPENAVTTRDGGWALGSIVDPVPLQVGEIAGVRAAILSYENRSPVARMETDAAPEEAPSTYARRIEAYAFPPKTTPYRLTALSFGYAFHVVPYVIGQGGTLPPALRAKPLDPLTMTPIDAGGAFAGQIRVQPGGDSERRSALYRRTRPIGAPRLLAAAPGVPDGVDPLAGELPIRPTPVTLDGTVEGRWFLDADGRGGVIDLPPGPFPGLRFDFGQVDWSVSGAARRLTVRLIGRKGDSEAVADLTAALVVDLANPCALRIEVVAAGCGFAVAPPPPYAEDDFDFPPLQDLATPAADIASWRDVGVHLSVDAEIDIEPPLATPLASASATGPYLEAARSRIAPEAGHQKRTIALLDGLNQGSPKGKATLRFRRPAVDFATYERWVNPPLFELSLQAGRDAVAAALDAARRAAHATAEASVDRSLDDSAVTRLYVELVRIFPHRAVVGFVPIGTEWSGLAQILGFDAGKRSGHEAAIGLEVGGVEALASDRATLAPGCIYELRVYAGLPERQDSLATFARDERLSPAVRATLRRCPLAAPHAAMRLAGPLVLTVEVATAAIPKIFDSRPLEFEWRRPPLKPEAAGIRLADRFAQRFYPDLRYCRVGRVEAQRWSWRGRPQDDLWPSGDSSELFETAFSDRSADDVGRALERPIERAHAYAGRPRFDAPPTRTAPDLVELGLDWRGGANLWRFGLALVSRYRALAPGRVDLVSYSHRTVGDATAWQTEILLDRPFDRPLARPALTLVLPLTEPVMAAGSVPPLLALFNEQLYAVSDANDGIEALVEVARHPFPLTERLQARLDEIATALQATPGDEALLEEQSRVQAQLDALLHDPDAPARLKYWAEWGPDPIRSGAGSEGALVPLRLDGPIGYGFDIGVVSGRFDHAGLLVSPVDPRVWPWSFVRLKFRRFEAPEAIDARAAFTAAGPAPDAGELKLCAPWPLPGDGTAKVLQLQNDRAQMNAGWPKDFADLAHRPADAVVFACEHQGLVLDLDARNLARAVVEIRFAKADGTPDSEWTRVEFTAVAGTDGPGIDCVLSTQLGPAGHWRLPTPAGADVRLRLALSARDKPRKGNTYRPAGDVALRARVGVSGGDRLSGEAENRWLAVASAPLTAASESAIDAPLRLAVKATGAAATAAPARLSGFTPAVWCQFAEAMSRFDATVEGAGRPLAAADLTATLDGTHLIFSCGQGRLDALAPAAQPAQGAATAQVEETFAVVLTSLSRDAFDRPRERPVAAMAWDPKAVSLDLASADWPGPRVSTDLGVEGQARFLRLLRPRPRIDGGFVDASPKFPRDFFDFATIEGEVDMNPPDAAGLILGMSKPIAWRLKK